MLKKTEFLANCTYTCETTAAALCNNMLYSVTSQSLETYVVPIYAAVSKRERASQQPSDIDDGVHDDGTAGEGGDTLSSCDGSLVPALSKASSQETRFTHFGFPVYDLEILRKVR